MFKYFPHTETDVQEMLKVVGVKSLDELYSEVPDELKYKGDLQIPEALSEEEVRNVLKSFADENIPLACFAGFGTYDHITPSVIPYLASRSEFSTSYTPYQAEISQGTLQYIFEYQSLMADLTGLDVSNASMYDGATATAEAMLMCVANAKKRNKVLISSTFRPQILDVVKTYAHFHGVELIEVPELDGETNKAEALTLVAQDDVAGLIVPQHNKYGVIEDLSGLAEECHAHKTLFVVNSIASDLGVLKTPGEWGADIACGDAQSLGIPMNFGGPYIGYLCVKNELVRKMPGRLVGATTDANGQRAFVLTLQAREQHIRREKATSNICTAQGYMCLHVAAYLSLMGPTGLREVNELGFSGAHYLHDELLKTGFFADKFADKTYLNEFTLRFADETIEPDNFIRYMTSEGILAGVKAGEHEITIAVTEKYTKEDLDNYVEVVNEWKNKATEFPLAGSDSEKAHNDVNE
ncbi:MAG: aminomethyl-transferring glycine dehydrogenase subunit GcvPA [Alloprevotella sp.]|nr:aminomethyl-transferring glycine dehydrogenase subunit GcvPA [Alloprevotella sp.]